MGKPSSGPMLISHLLIKRIFNLRTRRGWSNAVLSERFAEVGYAMSPQALSKQHLHNSTVSIDQAVATARVFGISIEELISEGCGTCGDVPPVGFACCSCGRKGGE